MNAQDARRTLLADPQRISPELEQMVCDDVELAKFRQQLLGMNDKLASAFGEVTPIAGLADRLILRTRYRRRSMWLAGVAASTLLVGALSVTMLRPEAESPLAVAMLDHVINEKGELADNGNISTSTARASLARIGVAYNDIGYQVRHIGECEVAGRIGRHVVMNTPQGVVTFLIMPQSKGELASRRVMNKGLFQAVFVPQKKAAYGVFAENKMNAQQLESMMGRMFVPMRDEI